MIIPAEGPRALFINREVEVLTAEGLKRTSAAVYREFAVVTRDRKRFGLPPYFEVFHLPSARSFCSAGACFGREDVACRAVVRIDRLRNEWSQVTLDELVAMTKAIADVCKGFGGKPPKFWLTDSDIDNTRNGYSGSAA